MLNDVAVSISCACRRGCLWLQEAADEDTVRHDFEYSFILAELFI